MNIKKAEKSILFGIASLFVFAISGIIFIFAAAYGTVNPVFGAEGGAPGIVNYFGMFVLAPAIAAFGCALPAHALGADWPRSLLIAATLVIAFVWAAFWGDSMLLIVIVAVLAAALVALLGSTGSNVSATGIQAVLIASAIFLLLAVLVSLGQRSGLGFLASVLAWITLPALAGLFRPQANVPEIQANE